MPLELTMICAPYDRARALIEGSVKPEGIDLRVHVDADDVNRHFDGHGGRYDVAEFFTGRYIVDLPFRTLGFTAVPIFVKRMFRHSYIYVNTAAGIVEPTDLNGKRVGIQSWFTTTALWARGILEEEHGVDLRSIRWVAGRLPRTPTSGRNPTAQAGGGGRIRHASGDAAGRRARRVHHHRHPGPRGPAARWTSCSRLRPARARLLPEDRLLPHPAHAAHSHLDPGPAPLGGAQPVRRLAGVQAALLRVARVAARAQTGLWYRALWKRSAPPPAATPTAGVSGKRGPRSTRYWNTPSDRASPGSACARGHVPPHHAGDVERRHRPCTALTGHVPERGTWGGGSAGKKDYIP